MSYMEADCCHLNVIPKDYNCSNYTAPNKRQKPISKYERKWRLCHGLVQSTIPDLASSLYQTVIFWVPTNCSAAGWHLTLKRYKLLPSSQFHHNILKTDKKNHIFKKANRHYFLSIKFIIQTINISLLNYAHSTRQASNNEWHEYQYQDGNRLGRISGRIMWKNIKQKLWTDIHGWWTSLLNKQYISGNAEKRGRSRRWLSSFKVLMGISVQILVLWVVTLYASEVDTTSSGICCLHMHLRRALPPLKMKTACSSRIIWIKRIIKNLQCFWC
jgi:hypothetical protein